MKLQHFDSVDVFAVFVVDMNGASEAGIEGVDGAEDFHGLFWIGYWRVHERRFVCRHFTFGIAG